MLKWYCVSFGYSDPMDFKVSIIESDDRDEAWKEVEETIATNCSTDIMMSEKEFIELRKLLNETKIGEEK